MGFEFKPAPVLKGWNVPHVDSAVNVVATPGFLVGTPVMVGRNTSFVVNATILGSVTFVFPYIAPDGVVITGFPYIAPDGVLDVITPPTALSRVSVLWGIANQAGLGGPWTVGGLYYGAGGIVARAVAAGIGTTGSAVVASGAFAEIKISQHSSEAVVGANGPPVLSVKVSPDKLGGAGETTDITSTADYTGQPYVIFQVASDGASGETAMALEVGHRHRAHFADAVLGG